MKYKNYLSIYRLRIIDIKYTTNYTKRTTRCCIWYKNPINGNIQKAIGVTVRNPNDMDNTQIAKRIAEGRAKTEMYKQYNDFIIQESYFVRLKYTKLIEHEKRHVNKIIAGNYD